MRRQVAVVALMLGALALLLNGCGGAKAQKKGPTKKEVASVRARSADAFEDLEAVERGDPTPSHKKAIEEEPPPKKPEPVVEKPYKPKPVETVKVNPARAAPGWVNAQPKMAGYYIGIGVSTSHGNEEDDWARARNAAYVELASTLKVHINSVIKDYFKENNMKLYKKDNVTKDVSRTDSSYATDTSFFVDQTLEGVEIHDRWKDTKQTKYWMLVRLSKAEIARRIKERLDKARKKALDYVQAAVKAQGAGRIGEAFKGYFHSYLALREYFGGVVEFDVNGDGKMDILNHEIERAVHRLASDMEWKVFEPNLKAVIGSGIKEPLGVTVSYKGAPVKSLPVAFSFQRGTGSIEKKVSTGGDGLATARVMKIFGEKKAILGARVDVEALVSGRNNVRIVDAKFGPDLDLKTGKFFIELEELSIYINISEENMGEEVQPGSIAADIKDKLNKELGVVFTDSSRGADMEIKGKGVTGSCSDFLGQRMCTARVNVTVSDRLKNRQIFSKKYKIKGTGDNDEEAGRDALRKAGPRIAKKIIKHMK
ncbi:MAG: LPP20 family lipoprotein [Deltaproteobacteria bacterium]|nr:LPP20 family lipoprotein [Deltaproteobacteria bacterium]